jgi:hypothetical protein
MPFTNGQTLTADALNLEFGESKVGTSNTAGTTTSTSYTATLTGSTVPSTTFVAPASGKVQLVLVTRCFTSTTAFVRFAAEVRDGAVVGSGTVRLAASDSDAGAHQTNVQTFRFTDVAWAPSLVPGATYNARLLVMVSTGTGTFGDMKILVIPQS